MHLLNYLNKIADFFVRFYILNQKIKMAEREDPIPEELHYEEKMRAIGKRKPAMHVEQSPDNGATQVSSTGKIRFPIQANQIGKFADLKNAYVAVDMVVTETNVITGVLGEHGSIACVSRATLSTNTNQIISDIYKKNVLDVAMNNTYKSVNWGGSTKNILYGGKGNNFSGESISTTETRYIIPLDKLGFDETFVPLSGIEDLKLELYLDSALNIFVARTGTGTPTATGITFSNMVLHYDVLELADDEFEDLLHGAGGKLVINSKTWFCQDMIITADDTGVSMTIGAGKQDVKRILVVQRSVVNDDELVNNKFSMGVGKCTSISLMHNGVELKNRPLSISNGGPEALIESIKAEGGYLYDGVESGGLRTRYIADGNVAAVTGTYATTSGCFVAMFDCQNGFQMDDTESGINITTGSTLLKLTKSGTTTNNMNLEVFVEYGQRLELDMLGDRRITVMQ